MRIQHNIPAMNAYRHYSNNTSALAKNLEKLSSGYKINRAGDDAAGLAISEKMRAQITGLEVAQKNAKDGISLVQTAEGALTEVHDMLNRMYSLAEQSANGTYDNEVDRKQLQKEVDSLKKEIDRISQATNFNGIKLLDGSLGNASSSAIVKVANPDSLNLADGVTINAPRDGDGKKASLDVTFLNENGTAFGAGDSVTFKVKDANGVEKSYTFNYDAATGAGADSANSATGKFTGATFAEQMTSLANQISATNDFNEYAATVKTDEDGNAVGVTITAKDDATVPNMTFVGGAGTGVIVKDTSVKVETSSYTPGANGNPDTTQHTTGGIDNLIVNNTANGNGNDIQPGDEIEFEFTVNGNTLHITLTASADGAGKNEFKIGKDTDTTTSNITTALSKAYFDDETATLGRDESQLKFSDYFTATANTKADGTASSSGSIQILANGTLAGNKNALNTVNSAIIKYADGSADATVTATAGTGGTAGGATTAAAKDSSAFKFSNTFSAGDQVVLTGKLSDGRDFEIALTATKDSASASDNKFQIGVDTDATVTNILNALKGDCKVKVSDADGNEVEVAGNAIFAGDDTLDFNVSATGSTLTIANAKAGAAGIKGATAKFSNLQVKSAGKMSVTDATATAGQTPGVAENIITFDDPSKIENGTTIQIDGKKYEFVTDASRKSGDTNTIAVEVENLGDGATAKDLATALAKALDSSFDVDNNSGTYTASLAGSDANGKVFDISVTDSALVLKSQDTGSAAKAIDDIKMSYDSRDVTELQFTTTEESSASGGAATYKPQVKVGDTVTVNGKTYELTNGGRTKGETNTAVDISGLTDVKDIVQKLADTIEANDTTVMATVETTKDDGGVVNGASLKLTGKYQDGAEVQFKAPAVETPKTSKSLDLQIGDDAEEYNRMLVEIDAVNVKELGLEGLDISTQTAARESMAKIKDAINYVSNVRGTLGATQNRLDHTINNLSVMQENIQDAESTIRDVDVAKEMMAYTKNNILVQSAQAMLAQANQLPQGVLQLLQ